MAITRKSHILTYVTSEARVRYTSANGFNVYDWYCKNAGEIYLATRVGVASRQNRGILLEDMDVNLLRSSVIENTVAASVSLN